MDAQTHAPCTSIDLPRATTYRSLRWIHTMHVWESLVEIVGCSCARCKYRDVPISGLVAFAVDCVA